VPRIELPAWNPNATDHVALWCDEIELRIQVAKLHDNAPPYGRLADAKVV
jgi:hypothetical protein